MATNSNIGFTTLNTQESMMIKVETKTWSRDSHGLFDYEANNTKNTTNYCNPKDKLVRKKNDIRSIADIDPTDLEERELCKISEENSRLF